MMRDVSVLLTDAMGAGKSILFEGAQARCSTSTMGLSLRHLIERVGWRRLHRPRHPAARDRARARRGEGVHDARRRGALPTELFGEMGNRLRESGNEYGAVTGRPRRCGWYDAVAVRYGVRIKA